MEGWKVREDDGGFCALWFFSLLTSTASWYQHRELVPAAVRLVLPDKQEPSCQKNMKNEKKTGKIGKTKT